MIKREFYETREDGVNLYRTYSDENFYILQNETGVEYLDAIDVEDAPFTYSETDKPIEEEILENLESVEEELLEDLESPVNE